MMLKEDVPERLRALIRELARSSYKSVELPQDLEILDGGLRFDSVAYAELLIMCEDDFGIRFDESWAERKQVKIGDLESHILRSLG